MNRAIISLQGGLLELMRLKFILKKSENILEKNEIIFVPGEYEDTTMFSR